MNKLTIAVILMITIPLQAQDITNKLGGNTANETYDVTDSADNVLFQVRGDGDINIGGEIISEGALILICLQDPIPEEYVKACNER